MTEPHLSIRSIAAHLPEVKLIGHRLHEDRRGTSERVFDSEALAEVVGDACLLEEVELVSWSRSSVVRGMHVQTWGAPQYKHIRCSRGSVHAVVLDLRHHAVVVASVELHESNRLALWVPPFCAFGYAVLSDAAEVHYRIFGARVPSEERVVAWDSFGHRWPIGNPVLSDRDAAGVRFDDVPPDLGWRKLYKS